jgi:acetyl-CoA carboxylase biotin carboxyl carrier protein
MNQKELKELIEFLIEKDIAEFELERGDVKVRIKRASEATGAQAGHEVHYVSTAAPAPVAHVAAAVPVAESATAKRESAPAAEEDLYMVKSPIVGTFYESPSPGSPPFFKIGDTVETGQILCIIEAMKLMNEIESDVSGEIVKRFANNGQPVEYGQPLFAIRTRK